MANPPVCISYLFIPSGTIHINQHYYKCTSKFTRLPLGNFSTVDPWPDVKLAFKSINEYLKASKQ